MIEFAATISVIAVCLFSFGLGVWLMRAKGGTS